MFVIRRLLVVGVACCVFVCWLLVVVRCLLLVLLVVWRVLFVVDYCLLCVVWVRVVSVRCL